MTTPGPSPASESPQGEPVVQKERAKRCMVYGVLCFLGFSMMLFVLLAVVPEYAERFREMGLKTAHLPVSTGIVLSMGATARKLWFLFLPVVPAVSYAVSRVPRRKAWVVEVGLILVLASFIILVVVGLFAPHVDAFGATPPESGQ